MSDSQPKWNADGSILPSIDPHTKAKHLILEQYIENLVLTLYAKALRGVTKFTFIDGFCGGGMYMDKDNDQYWEGSPIRIIKAVREGHKKSKRVYEEPLNIKFIFIDSKKSHLTCLKKYSMIKAGLEELIDENPHYFDEGYGQRIEQCIFLHGEFEKFLSSCISTVESHKGHSLFFLDPFGWTDVSMQSIREINSLKGSEILYTYMIDYIRRFLIERYTTQKRGFKEVLEADGYYEDANLEDSTVGEQCYLRDQTLKLFLEKGNAKYVFTFALIPKGENNAYVMYYLLHISQHLTALEVIKGCFDSINNLNYQYHYEVYGCGFKTANYYNENQMFLEFDINKGSYEFCMDKLDGDVGKMIQAHPDGISFQEIRQKTMALNPASRRLYEEYIQKYVLEKELEILQNGKLLTGCKIKLRNKDIIKLPSKYQLSLFYKSKFFPNRH